MNDFWEVLLGKLEDLTKNSTHLEDRTSQKFRKLQIYANEVAFGAHPTSLCVNGIGNFQNIT